MPDFNYHVKSPLNYTGNKYRILAQIKPHFPQHIHTMVDLFCGGATVGLNTPCEQIIFIDNNPFVISLLQYLSTCKFNILLYQLEQLISHYNLSYSANASYAHFFQQQVEGNRNNGLKKYNSVGYYQLRDDYNAIADKQSEQAQLLLYLLIIYGFNNDIRFSKDDKFNLPCGKTDLNKNNLRKLKDYIERVQALNAEFSCGDFRNEHIRNIIMQADFIYADPPYLISDAVYNESNKWNEQTENELLDLLTECLHEEKPFALSNILEKENVRINKPLTQWIEEYANHLEVIPIDYHYRGASYNKKQRNAAEKEVLIISRY